MNKNYRTTGTFFEGGDYTICWRCSNKIRIMHAWADNVRGELPGASQKVLVCRECYDGPEVNNLPTRPRMDPRPLPSQYVSPSRYKPVPPTGIWGLMDDRWGDIDCTWGELYYNPYELDGE